MDGLIETETNNMQKSQTQEQIIYEKKYCECRPVTSGSALSRFLTDWWRLCLSTAIRTNTNISHFFWLVRALLCQLDDQSQTLLRRRPTYNQTNPCRSHFATLNHSIHSYF